MDDAAGGASWSLQQRLRRQLSVALAVLWLAGSVGALAGLWHETSEVLDSALAEMAQRLLVLPESALDDAASERMFLQLGPHREFVAYQVFDAAGRLRMRSHSAPQRAFDADGDGAARPGEGWRVFAYSRPDGSRRVLVAEAAPHRREVIWAALGWLMASLALVLLGAEWLLRYLLKRAFRQVEAARRQLETRPADDLTPVTAIALPREMGPWIATINELMTKVRSLVEAERTLSAQAAHELRTPLAAARAQAQRLAIVTDPAAMQAGAQALLRQIDRLARMSTRLLQLARLESGVPLRRDPVDLASLADLVAAEFTDAAGAADAARLCVEAGGPGTTVPGDVDLLGIALRNLIENGLKHGGAAAAVRVTVGASGIEVIDDGPGVAAPELAGLVKPFRRGEGLSEGSGLGLFIADRIARLSGATLVLRSPVAQGRGFAAAIRFRD